MRVLLTGGTGFIGTALRRRLAESGHNVVCLTRNPEVARRGAPKVEAFLEWKPGAEPPPAAFAGVEVVVNLAGETVAGRWTAGKKRRIYDSRIEGTNSLVAAIKRSGRPRVLVSASAVGFYGDRGDELLTEESPSGEGFLAEVTRDWEKAAVAAAPDVRVAIMRLGIVLGHGGGALKAMLPIFKFGIGGSLGRGKQWWPWVHLDDVVAGIQQAVEQPYEGIYNLTAPEPVRQAEFARQLAHALHRPAVLPMPGPLLRLVQGEFADEVLFSKRVLPGRLEAAGFQFAHPGLHSAVSDLFGKEASRAPLPTGA